jgi:branched-chain amino acid transport system ATP-binding protein
MLEVKRLSKQFGGLYANRDVSLSLKRQHIHALIGPNGAGKSTLVAQIAGELKPDSGTIEFNGRDITHDTPERRNRMGMGRMFQTTALFNELSVLDNIRIPLLRSKPPNFSMRNWFYKTVENDLEINATALGMLKRLGLEQHPEQRVATLSHGEQRQLEMVMTLATSPSCLLLDEPMAGMSSEESMRMTRLIHRLKKDHAILLVEHDMRAVFDLADTISVLVEGSIIASGTPDEIRSNIAVQVAYLGED